MSKQFKNSGPLSEKFDDYEFEPSDSSWDSIHDALNAHENSAPLGDKFAGDLEPVSVDVWTAIEKELHPKKKRRFILWWSGVAAGIVFVIMMFNLDGEDNSSVARNNFAKEGGLLLRTKSKNFRKLNHKSKAAKMNRGAESLKLAPTISLPLVQKEKNPSKKKQEAFHCNVTVVTETLEEEFDHKYFPICLPVKKILQLDSEKEFLTENTSVEATELLLADNRKKSNLPQNGIQIGFSPMVGLEKQQSDLALTPSNSTNFSNTSDVVVIDNTGNVIIDNSSTQSSDLIFSSSFTPVSESFAINSFVQVSQRKEYNKPFSLGMMYNIGLSSKLTLITGLEYTMSSYRYAEGYWKAYNREGRKAYLGIPLVVSANMIHYQRIKLYPLLGAKVFRGISGREVYRYKINNGEVVEEVEKVDNVGVGLSCSAGLGTRVNIYKKLNFYFQVSSEYAFKAPEDSYWEKTPHLFLLQGGLSIDL